MKNSLLNSDNQQISKNSKENCKKSYIKKNNLWGIKSARLFKLFLIGIIGIVIFLNYGLRFLFQPSGQSSFTHVNLSKQDQEMIVFLQKYIQIDTTHPKPNYKQALNFLKQHANHDGFLYQEILLPSDRPVLIITLQGTDRNLPALVLNHHIDVVPALNIHEWKANPFEGALLKNLLIGRGVQDMKGIGALHYFALKALKNSSIKPKRTIHIFAVPDEEIGGFTGTKELVKTDQFRQLNVGYVLDEGHASGDKKFLDLKISERKPLQITIIGKGSLSHGSHLMCFNTIHELTEFLHRITKLHKEQQKKATISQPGQLLSLNITSLTAGVKKDNGHIALNVVPDCAQATIDIRIPPTMKLADIKILLEKELKPFKHLSYSIEAQATEEPELQEHYTELYKALEKTIQTFGLTVRPHFFEGASDLRFYLDRQIDGIGLTPFTIEDNIHGTNESVPLDELIRGKKIIEQFLLDFCC